DYEFVSGTALAGEDFVSSRGSATIAAGERNHQLSLMVNPDARYEADETLEVVLSNLNNAQTTGLRGNRAVITLQNDDAVPTIYFTSAVQTVSETVGEAVVTVAIDAASGFDATFNLGITGTAQSGSDYTIPPPTQ